MTFALSEARPIDAVAPPSARATGLVFAGAALLGAVLVRDAAGPALGLAAFAAAMAGLGLIAPGYLAPLARAWFALSMAMHRVMSPVTMFVLFALVIVPFGLVMRLFHDPLARRRCPAARSYWHEKSRDDLPPGDMRNQF